MNGLATALQMPNLRVVGLHCHIGSNIMGLDSFEMAASYDGQICRPGAQSTGYRYQ